jgi:hypothetical protein
MRLFTISFILFLLFTTTAAAQYSAQREAMYMATLKAVADYKINDEENLRNVESLRENQRFNRELTKMLSKLSNRRTKDSVNEKVYKILLQAGKEIYNELD